MEMEPIQGIKFRLAYEARPSDKEWFGYFKGSAQKEEEY